MHADFSFLPDGTLNGAMTQQDADKAVSLLADGTYRKVDATHVVHLDKPDLYIDVLHDFFLQPHLIRQSQKLSASAPTTVADQDRTSARCAPTAQLRSVNL